MKYFFTRRKIETGWTQIESSCRVTKNKFFEFNVYGMNPLARYYTPVELRLELKRKTDHAGFWLSMKLLFIDIDIIFYDHRHWDDKTDRYEPCREDTCSLTEEEDYPLGIG